MRIPGGNGIPGGGGGGGRLIGPNGPPIPGGPNMGIGNMGGGGRGGIEYGEGMLLKLKKSSGGAGNTPGIPGTGSRFFPADSVSDAVAGASC
jgi:hypothetical protein